MVRFSNRYRNIYSSYLEKQTPVSSAKSNTRQDGCSLCVCSGAVQALHCIPWIALGAPACACVQWVAAALFSILLHNYRNFLEVVTIVWNFLSSIINFLFFIFIFFIFYNVCFLAGSASIPWLLSASSEGCSSAFAEVSQHEGNCCFSRVLHEAGRRDLRACVSPMLPPRFLYGPETHLAQCLHKCLHIKSDSLADLSSCPC